MPTRLHHLLSGQAHVREWLSMSELAEHGKFPSSEAARKWVRRQPELPVALKGRHLLVEREAFDRYVLARGLKRSA